MQGKMFFIFLSVFLAVLICPMMASASYFADTITAYMQNGSYCWFCPVFVAIFKGIDAVATNIAVQLAGAFLALLAAGLLFWIVFYVGRTLLQMQPIDMSKFFTDMLGTTGRAVVAAALLYSFFGVFTYIISPVLTMSMGLSSSIMEAGGFTASITKSSQTFAKQTKGQATFSLCQSKLDKDQNIIGYTGASNCDETWGDGNHAFTKEVCSAMECSIRSMSASLIGGIAIGSSLTSAGGLFTKFFWKWDLGGIIIGIFLVIGYFIIFLAFPFKMIDALIRLGFVCALAPLFIVLWVFPATRTYTQKAWQMLLGSCMTFVFLAVIMVLILSILSFALPQGAAQDAMLKALLNGQDSVALSYINFSGSQFFVTIAVCFIGWKLLGMAETFSSTFGGVNPQVGAGAAAAGFAAGGAKLGYKAGKVGAKGAYEMGKWAAGKTTSAGLRGAGMTTSLGRSAARRLGLVTNTSDDLNMSKAFREPNNARNNSAVFKDADGNSIRAVKNSKGVVSRLVKTGKDGKSQIFDGKGNFIGTHEKTEGGGYKITNAAGQVVESKSQNKDGSWTTSKFAYDKNGKQRKVSDTVMRQEGNKLIRETSNYANGRRTYEESANMRPADAEQMLADGGHFSAQREEVYQMQQNEKGVWDAKTSEKISETEFKQDNHGNIISSVERNLKTGETFNRTMDGDGVVTTRTDSNGVVHNSIATDLSGNERGLYFSEEFQSSKIDLQNKAETMRSTVVDKPKKAVSDFAEAIRKKLRGEK